MALPADGSPMLEEHLDDGKDHGKMWSDEDDMVSEDHREGSRCSSPLQSVDCGTSSSEDEVSNAGTTSSSDNEADNEDQDDFKSRLLFAKVLIEKFLESLHQFNLRFGQRVSADSSSTVDHASAVSQLLEIPPPNFKDIQDIGVAQNPQEDMAPRISLEYTSGLDKQEEPFLNPENSRPIGTSQHHQVGLEEDGASLSFGCVGRTTKNMDAAQEDNPPSKLSFGIVLPSSFKFTYELNKQEEPILHPEDSNPISASPQPLAGWRNLVATLTVDRASRTTKKVDDAKEDDVKEDDPTSNPSHQVVLKEDMVHVTSGLDKQEEPILHPEDSSPVSASPQPLAGWKNLVASLKPTKKVDDAKEDDPSHQVGLKEDMAHVTSGTAINRKRTKDSDAEEELPNKKTRDSVDANQEPSAKRIRENQTEDVLPSKRTRESDPEEEPPAKTTKYGDDSSWDEVLQRIGRRMAWRYGKEWEDPPIPSTPLFIPYRKTDHEDPILLSPVLSPSPRRSCEDPCRSSPIFSPSCRMPCKRPVLSSPVLSPLREMIHENLFLSSPDFSSSPLTHCEDPILSLRVFSPSPSTHSENSPLSSPGFCVWMETEGDTEEEPTPSTSGGITASSRRVWFRPRYVLSDSD